MRITLYLLMFIFFGINYTYAQCPDLIQNTQGVSCNGENDGSVLLDGSGGTPPYEYSNDGTTYSNNNIFTGLAAGCATFYIRDAVSCVNSDMVCISEPQQLTLTANENNGVSCTGEIDGSATVIAAGGTPPYDYLWDTADSGSTSNSLGGGIHSVVVTDTNGCAATATVLISEPSFLTATITVTQDASCAACNGSATINVTGGILPYSYLWNGGETTATNSSLCAGNYNVTVTDVNGCQTIAAATINNSNTQLVVTLSPSNETCQGQDGGVSTTITGGDPPYFFQWNNGANTQDLANLPGGYYSLTVVDANGCLGTESTQVLSASTISINVTDATCDQADGMVVATTSNPNSSFAWSTGETSNSISNLAQGWYSLTVVNLDDSCVAHRNVYVDEELSCKVLIDGYVMFDEQNEDCINDSSTTALEYRYAALWSGSTLVGATFTDSMGYYRLVADNGTYDLEVGEYAVDSFLCPTSNSITVNAATNGQTYSNDFYLSKKDVPELSVFLDIKIARPGFQHYEYITYCNNGNLTMDGKVTLVHDSLLTNFTSTPLASSYDAQNYTATWNFVDLEPGGCVTIVTRFLTPATTPLGTLLTGAATIDPIQGDFVPSNNSTVAHTVVTGSYDPNDKQNMSSRDPFGGDIDPDIETYHYRIRFQNTGTDTAFTVVVKDEIEANLDISSVRTVAASHDYSMDVENGNTLVFFFEDIMLPDSNVNEPVSHGFIYFTIDRAPNLPLGTEIKNDAAIYFDFNAPVITNEVVNVLADPNGIKPNVGLNFSATVFPNPASGIAFLSLEMEEGKELDVEVLDVQGRSLATLHEGRFFAGGKHTIPLDVALNAGIYFVRVKTGDGVLTRKFVVLR